MTHRPVDVPSSPAARRVVPPRAHTGSTLDRGSDDTALMATRAASDERTCWAVEWLADSPEPAIRMLTRTELLGGRVDQDIVSGPMVHALLRGDEPGGA